MITPTTPQLFRQPLKRMASRVTYTRIVKDVLTDPCIAKVLLHTLGHRFPHPNCYGINKVEENLSEVKVSATITALIKRLPHEPALSHALFLIGKADLNTCPTHDVDQIRQLDTLYYAKVYLNDTPNNPFITQIETALQAHINAQSNNAQRLINLIQTDDLETFQSHLTQHPILVFFNNSYHITPLHVASRMGRLTMVHAILAKRADINAQNDDGDTSLHIALENNHLETALSLIHAGANVNIQNAVGATPLFIAATNGYFHMVEALLIAGADVTRQDEWGTTPLFWARARHHHAIITILLDAHTIRTPQALQEQLPKKALKRHPSFTDYPPKKKQRYNTL